MMHDGIVIPKMGHDTIEGIVSKMAIVDVDTAERRKYMMDGLAAFFHPTGGQFVCYSRSEGFRDAAFWRLDYENEVHLLDSVSLTAEREAFYPEMDVYFDNKFLCFCPREEEHWTFAQEGAMFYCSFVFRRSAGRCHDLWIAYGSSIGIPPKREAQDAQDLVCEISDWDPSDFD